MIGRSRNSAILASLILAAGSLLASSAAFGQVVKQGLGDHIIRYFADEQASRDALPSYAILPSVKTGSPSGVAITPVFSHTDTTHTVTISIDPGTSLYGTGEVSGPLVRNGRMIQTWNTDAYGYGEDAKSLYQSHPWVLAVRPDGTAFGVLADTTYRCTVDAAAAKADQVTFTAPGPAFPVIVIDRKSPQAVLEGLAEITGTMPMPPKWAIGYHQCRYSYYPEARVRQIAKEFRDRKIPCDVIWFDIDYMDHFRIFSFNHDYFPDPKKLNSDLLAQGFHNVWMIDPGVKAEDKPGVTEIFDSGNQHDAWVKRASGEVYKGQVWPGWCVFPDFTSPTVRTWWAGFYKDFMAQGITGVWNDMNEPAIFNVPSKTMPEDNIHKGDPAMLRPDGKPQDDAAADKHERYHNVYGMLMVMGTREGIAKANPDKRPFVLSRDNYIGGQRYAATWTGDNTASWPHLKMSIPMVLNVGLSGQPFIGPDIGGFNGNGDGKLFARWFGFGAMFPFSRGHTGKENINKEPWAFGPAVEATCREALERRYQLLPYYYTLFHEASVTGLPVARPTFFADPKDPSLRAVDDSFLLGKDVLVVADVDEKGAATHVMPRGNWPELLAPKNPDLPHLYARPGSIVPLGPIMQYSSEKPLDTLTLYVTLDDKGHAAGTLYEDAGDGYGYQRGEQLLSTYEASRNGGTVTVKLAKSEGRMKRPARKLAVHLLTDHGDLTTQGTDGQPVTIKSN